MSAQIAAQVGIPNSLVAAIAVSIPSAMPMIGAHGVRRMEAPFTTAL
jgi:hypothetical protein